MRTAATWMYAIGFIILWPFLLKIAPLLALLLLAAGVCAFVPVFTFGRRAGRISFGDVAPVTNVIEVEAVEEPVSTVDPDGPDDDPGEPLPAEPERVAAVVDLDAWVSRKAS